MHTAAPIPLTTALAHEALVPRLEALLKQLEKLALRRADSPVTPDLLRIAETLFAEVKRFTPLFGRTRRFRRAITNAALFARLGQARAALDAFEARHAPWDQRQAAYAWMLANGARRPVRRIRQRPVPLPQEERTAKQSRDLRTKIAGLLDSKYQEGFRAGLAARGPAPDTLPTPYADRLLGEE